MREILIKESLIGVISLPSGVFQPYSGVKTSIMILDKQVAKSNSSILFSNVQAIGVSLGIKRTIMEKNDLPIVLKDFGAYHAGTALSSHSWLAARSDVLSGDCSLSGERYRPIDVGGGTRTVKLGEVCTLTKGAFSSTKTEPGPYPLIVTAEQWLSSNEFQLQGEAVCVPLISSTGHGRASIKRIHLASGQFALANLLVALQPKDPDVLNTKFLYLVLDLQKEQMAGLMKGAANVSMKVEDLAVFSIPLPPLDVQKEIVEEIEGYQKVVDGARTVVNNYRPHIPIDPAWPMAELGSIAKLINGRAYKQEELLNDGKFPVLRVGNFFSNRGWYYSDLELEEEKYCNQGDLLYAWSASFGPQIWEGPRAIYHYHIWKIETTDAIDKTFLFHLLEADSEKIKSEGHGIGMMHATKGGMEMRKFPLPSLPTQQAIVAEIEAEKSLVAASRELIARLEKKIHSTLARVWGGTMVAEG